MFKFMDREVWLAVINQWILDGSKLVSFDNSQECEWVVLRGKDGGREELYWFYTEEAFEANDDMQPWGHNPQERLVGLYVTVRLDPVPGEFHTTDSAVNTIDRLLKATIGHYNPKVSLTK